MSVFSFSLPTELTSIIVRIAATQSHSTAASLCLVSKWFREEVTPILYRVVVMRSKSREEYKTLLCDRYMAHAQSLGLCKIPPMTQFYRLTRDVNVLETRVLSLLHPKPRIRNLMTYTLGSNMAEIFPSLEQLHIYAGHRGITLPAFPHLRQIHYLHVPTGVGEDPAVASGHYRTITHIAFTLNMYSRQHLSFEHHIRAMLNTYPMLLLIVVRLYCPVGETYTDQHEYVAGLASALAHLGAIPDPRLVVMVIQQHGLSSVAQRFEEWEKNAGKEQSIWEQAIAAIATKSIPSTAVASDVAADSHQKPHIIEFTYASSS